MRRLAVVLLVLLPLLGAGAVVADRVVHSRAEHQVLMSVSEEVALGPGADVEIDGFPFLTQLVAGRLAEVRGRAESAAFDGVTLTDVRVTARGVSPQEPYRAETVEVNAGVPVQTLRAVLAEALPPLEGAIELTVVDDRLQLSGEVADIELAVGLEPVVVEGQVGVEVGEVSAGDQSLTDSVVLDGFNELLEQFRLTVPGLPDGLTVSRLEVVEDGLEVRLAGEDLVFTTD